MRNKPIYDIRSKILSNQIRRRTSVCWPFNGGGDVVRQTLPMESSREDRIRIMKTVSDEGVIMVCYDDIPTYIVRRNGKVLTYKLREATMEDMSHLLKEEEKNVRELPIPIKPL